MFFPVRPAALFFDLDGTLGDTVPGLYKAVLSVLSSLGYPPVTEDMVRSYVGNGVEMLLIRSFARNGDAERSEFPDDLIKKARSVFNQVYPSVNSMEGILYPHVAETLAFLQNNGIKLAVVTNKPNQFVKPMLESGGIFKYFSGILGGDIIKEKKPNPAAVFYMLDKLDMNTLPHNMVAMVGDSINDINAAKNAGIVSIGMTYGYNRGISIKESMPDYVFDDFGAIKSLIASLGS